MFRKFSDEGEEKPKDPETDGWHFKFVTRAFRTVLMIDKNSIPAGYLNLDDKEDIMLWKKVEELLKGL